MSDYTPDEWFKLVLETYDQFKEMLAEEKYCIDDYTQKKQDYLNEDISWQEAMEPLIVASHCRNTIQGKMIHRLFLISLELVKKVEKLEKERASHDGKSQSTHP